MCTFSALINGHCSTRHTCIKEQSKFWYNYVVAKGNLTELYSKNESNSRTGGRNVQGIKRLFCEWVNE